MRYNPPALVSEERANAWVGKKVRTTREREGTVESVTVVGNVIYLYCVDYFGLQFMSSNELCTMVRENV
jgi:hypothetical protein